MPPIVPAADAPFAIRARYVIPVTTPVLRDACLTCAAGRIVAVGENLSGRPALDLGDAAVLPGLVNAHTHLEFSDLAQPLVAPGSSFVPWLEALLQRRRAAAELPDSLTYRRAAIRQGLAESLAAGVTTLGEIASGEWLRELAAPAPQVTVFAEVLGLSPERAAATWAVAEQLILHHDPAQVPWDVGISPHAPYSTPLELIERACRLSAARRIPLALHLAETTEELELLQSASGPLREALVAWGVWRPAGIPRGVRPWDYLQLLRTAARVLLVHGNYLTAHDHQLLAECRDRMSVVYCPRTHAFFGHAQYPLGASLAAGVAVCVGTDSRGSNPDLDLWEELRCVATRHPELAPDKVLRLGTIHGARALGLAEQVGSLEAGKWCDLLVADAAGAEAVADPVADLLARPLTVRAVYRHGECLLPQRGL